MNDALHCGELGEIDRRAALRGTAPNRRRRARRARDVFHLKMNDAIARHRNVLPLFAQNDARARKDDAGTEKEENVCHHVHSEQPNRWDAAGNVTRERRRRRHGRYGHGEPGARQRPSHPVFERVVQTAISRRYFLFALRPVVVNDEDVVGADTDREKQSREVKRAEPTLPIHTEIRRVREDGGAGDAQRSSDADDDRARLERDERDRHAH